MATITAARTYTSLDGAQIKVAPSLGADVFSCVAHATFARPEIGRFEFVVGPRHLGRDLAFDPQIVVDTEIVDEYAFGGGDLVMASGFSPADRAGEHWELTADGVAIRETMNIAIWEGRNFSFHTFRYGPPDPALDGLLEVFGHVALDERPDGVAVRPDRNGKFFLDDGPTIMQDVPGVALVEIRQLTQRNASVLPRRRGTRVRGGELFAHVPERDDPHAAHVHARRDIHPETFLHKVTPSAIVTVLPHARAGERRLMDLATSLRVDWSGAG